MAALLRQARMEAGLTQRQLAELLGITQGAVSSWERGVTRPRVEALPKLAAALGLPINALPVDRRLSGRADVVIVDEGFDVPQVTVMAVKSLPQAARHTQVTGRFGSGKTNTMAVIVRHLLELQAEVMQLRQQNVQLLDEMRELSEAIHRQPRAS